MRIISPAFFATLGLPIIARRDFNDADRSGSEPVAIISESVARRAFPDGDAVNHHVMWTDPIMKAVPLLSTQPLRVIGVVLDVDDIHIVPRRALTVYRPFGQETTVGGGHLFVRVTSNPYELVPAITHLLRNMSADQPVEHAATLEGVRAQVLSSDGLSVIVFSAFAAVALPIAVVGVAGVLAFSVSGRTREFGIRLAFGSEPRRLLMNVITEGVAIAIGGLAAGLLCGYALAGVAGSFLADLKMTGTLPVASAALILLLAAITASAIPAMRAARVDVIQALRTE